jgi:hypothetical protein
VPYFTIFAVIFIVVFTVRNRQNRKKQADLTENFWNRELEANSTRKQDISNLDYVSIPFEIFPPDIHAECKEKLWSLSDKKILNLTGMTNTQLKQRYGAANLEFLGECDANFADLVYCIGTYADELLKADRPSEAKQLLEFGVSVQADSSFIYTTLGKLYRDAGETEQLQSLIEEAQKLNSIQKTAILSKLSAYVN